MPKHKKKHRTPIWQRPTWKPVSYTRSGPYVSIPEDYQDILSTFDCIPTPEQVREIDRLFDQRTADFQKVRSGTNPKSSKEETNE